MIVRKIMWDKISHKFTEDEKAEFRNAVIGEMICPGGWMMDEAKLSPELLKKLKKAMERAKR